MDQVLSLSIDGGSPKIITNLSKQSTLNFDSPLYVGGKRILLFLTREIIDNLLRQYALRNTFLCFLEIHSLK